jgi:hypothetical protein
MDFHLTGVLLFLVPGLCAYGALYQIFGSWHFPSTKRDGSEPNHHIAPTPPTGNSIKTIIIILLWSLLTHALTSLWIALCHVIYPVAPLITLPSWVIDDPYSQIVTLPGPLRAGILAQLLTGALAQGAVSIVIVQRWLRRRTRDNTLPKWLYGWTSKIANLIDDDDVIVVVWLLTTTDVAKGILAYSGKLRDLTVRSDGAIVSISLEECERYIVQLGTPFFSSDQDPLSVFSDLTIEGSQIRNVTIEEVPYEAMKAFNLEDLEAETQKELPLPPAP